MSHFAVLVVLPEPPTKGAIDKALAPWHEFNGTGYDHEYVVEEDITDEALRTIEKWTETRLRDSNGVLHDRWDSEGEKKLEFTRIDERGERVFYVPEGFEEVEMTLQEAGVDIAEWIADYHGMAVLRLGESPDFLDAHKYGWVSVNDAGEIVRVTKRTNPNGKWDYWILGGRYAGRLKPGYDPEKDPANQEECYLCYGSGKRDDDVARDHRRNDPGYTCNGCDGTGSRPKWPSKWIDVGNKSRWGDLDLPALKATRIQERRAFVDDIREKTGLSMDEFEIGHAARKAAHAIWSELPEPRPRGHEYSEWLRAQPHGDAAAKIRIHDNWNHIDPEEGRTVADWIEDAPALSAYAVVNDGKWCAQGDMGWFGISLGEKDDWQSHLQAILSQIPDDHYVAFVDCHT